MRADTVSSCNHIISGINIRFPAKLGLYVFILLCLTAVLPTLIQAQNPQSYIVKNGDTLSEIAQRYQVSVAKLRRWNSLRDEIIISGQRLRISPDGVLPRYVVRSGETLSEIADQFEMPIALLKQLNDISDDRIYPGQLLKLQELPQKGDGARTHKVKKGDTLWRIAENYDLSVSTLRELNQIKENRIYPGDLLVVQELPDEASEGSKQFEYMVQKGDTLSEIAQRHNVSVGLIRQLNRLNSDHIMQGSVLQLQPSSVDEVIHIVRKGEALSQIASKYKLSLEDLIKINGLENSSIQVGQKLRVKEASARVHLVERGDALWEIASSYGMTVDEIKKLNHMTSDVIYPGQELRLTVQKSAYDGSYQVKPGDYLADIARLHQMSVAEIKSVNQLRTSIIHPGDILRVRPLLRREENSISEDADFFVSSPAIRTIDAPNGPYYFWRPKADRQARPAYYEGPLGTPLENYRQAIKLWEVFESEVSHFPQLSDDLNGWHFVLDPGHGGLDPGAVVKSLDGNGRSVYVVEDEYVYDVALRVYVLLKRHGADVTLTMLSPNHLIRHTAPPVMTFVNEKNEVYNRYEFNRPNTWRCWPSGGRNGNLDQRVQIARRAFRAVPKARRIFLSFHADIEPASPEATLALYYKSRNREDLRSKRFAERLLPTLGAGAHIRGRNLGVLRDNPADVSLLIEVRNLAYIDHAWALRYEELRQRDAEKIVRGMRDCLSDSTRTASR